MEIYSISMDMNRNHLLVKYTYKVLTIRSTLIINIYNILFISLKCNNNNVIQLASYMYRHQAIYVSNLFLQLAKLIGAS